MNAPERWLATIEGNSDLECRFWLPSGCNEAQARYRAVEIWSHARSGAWTFERPEAALGLRVVREATEPATVPARRVA